MSSVKIRVDINAHIDGLKCDVVKQNEDVYVVLKFDNLGYGSISAIKFDACGFNSFGDISVENHVTVKPKMLDKMKNDNGSRGVVAVMCIFAVILIVFGYKSITDSSYEYAVDNYEYYEEQMEDTNRMANIYGGTGILGGGYANISDSWEDMLEEARETILIGRVKAGVGFGLGSTLLIFAIFLFVKGKKNGKTSTFCIRTTYSKSLSINAMNCAIIAVGCLCVYNVLGIYNVISSVIKYDYYSLSILTVINYFASISLLIMLSIGKKHIGFLLATGSIIALYVHSIIEVAPAGFSLESMATYFLECISHVILFILFLFMVIKALNKKEKVIKCLWFVPATINLIALIIDCVRWKYFSHLSSTWNYILMYSSYAVALFFIGLWIKKSVIKAIISEDNLVT